MVQQGAAVARPAPTWCLCVSGRLASLSVGLTYLTVNVAALAAGVVYLAVTGLGGGDARPAHLQRGLLPAVLGGGLVCVLNATACLLLVVGVRRARWRLVFAWLAWYAVFQSLLTLAWLGGLVHLVQDVAPRAVPSATTDFSWSVLVPVLPVGIIVLAFVWYAYAAVLAHCRQLRTGCSEAHQLGNYSAIRET